MKNIFILSLFTIPLSISFCAETSNKSPLIQRRSKSADPLEALFVNINKTLDTTIEELEPVHIRFAEFDEPNTPSVEEVKIYELPIYLECTPELKVSLIFKPTGGSYTPKKNLVDVGYKTGDDIYDRLKHGLPKDPQAPFKLLSAVLAKKARLYLDALKDGRLEELAGAERIIKIAQFHKHERIAAIITYITSHKKHDTAVYQKYQLELCKLQKPAEEALRAAGLNLIKSSSQDKLCT